MWRLQRISAFKNETKNAQNAAAEFPVRTQVEIQSGAVNRTTDRDVRYWHKADIRQLRRTCPLSGVKRTLQFNATGAFVTLAGTAGAKTHVAPAIPGSQLAPWGPGEAMKIIFEDGTSLECPPDGQQQIIPPYRTNKDRHRNPRRPHSRAYLEVGDPNGPLVIHNHGGPSSRLEARLFANSASKFGCALYA